MLKGAKPILSEVGPYAYREYYQKFDIEWTDDGDTVTYNTQRYYIFDQANSGYGLTEDDNITLPYPAVIGFEYLINQLPPEAEQAYTDGLLVSLLLPLLYFLMGGRVLFDVFLFLFLFLFFFFSFFVSFCGDYLL